MSNIFDDEGSEEEYQAKATEETPVQELDQQPAEQYQAAYEEPAYDNQQPPADDYEYQPVEEPHQQPAQQEQDYNPYVEPEQQPATQASIETPAAEQIPASEMITGEVHASDHANEHPDEKAAHNKADQKLNDAATVAKNELLSQISGFNQVSEKAGISNAESFEAEDSSSHLFSVTNPVKVGSVVKYTVTGQDAVDGRWEVQRRYNEFHILHVTLNERWPGCFIPCIPEKQILGDKEDGFIEERRSLLNRFIFECSKFEFIINSEEFKIFAKQPGEVGETLEKLMKQRPTSILEKYRLCFKIDEQIENMEVAKFREKINQFNQFLVKAVMGMQKDRLMLNNAATQYSKSFEHYGSVYKQFMSYEETAVEFFSDNKADKRILTHADIGDFPTKLKDTLACYKSPFAEAALWIKGEMLDIQGMIDAIKGRESVMKKQIARENQRRSDQEELEKLSLGKTTMKSFFKSKTGKEQDILNLQAKIEAANVDIEDFRKLIQFITIYHGQMAIDKFKQQKMHQYRKMLANMSARSINNAYLAATLNSGVLQVFEQQK